MTPICEAVPAQSSAGGPFLSTRGQILATGCACTALSLFVYAVDPSRHAVYPQCLLYNLTGIYCAGCGATRSLHALLHGRLVEAIHDNALFVAALPILLWVTGSYLLSAWVANQWPVHRTKAGTMLRQMTGVVAVALIFMVLRNAPGWPFELLRPVVR